MNEMSSASQLKVTTGQQADFVIQSNTILEQITFSSEFKSQLFLSACMWSFWRSKVTKVVVKWLLLLVLSVI